CDSLSESGWCIFSHSTSLLARSLHTRTAYAAMHGTCWMSSAMMRSSATACVMRTTAIAAMDAANVASALAKPRHAVCVCTGGPSRTRLHTQHQLCQHRHGAVRPLHGTRHHQATQDGEARVQRVLFPSL